MSHSLQRCLGKSIAERPGVKARNDREFDLMV
jgi:hypothetical protein